LQLNFQKKGGEEKGENLSMVSRNLVAAGLILGGGKGGIESQRNMCGKYFKKGGAS